MELDLYNQNAEKTGLNMRLLEPVSSTFVVYIIWIIWIAKGRSSKDVHPQHKVEIVSSTSTTHQSMAL